MKSHESEIKIKITRYKKISKRDLCADNIVDLSQKDNFLFSLFKNSLVKITALLLIIVLNWAGIYAIGSTLGYFGDKEISVENKLEAGILDFELASEHDFLPSPLNLGEYATRTISIINNANLFKYTASSTDFSSEVCQYFDLVADMDDVTAEYSGKLTDFNISSSSLLYFSDPEDWFFKLTPVNNFPNDLLGQTCSFKFVFEGSQTRNDLSFLEGFTDREEISNSIAVKKACRCVSLRSMGFWKNHPEIYKDYLPQELGCQMVNFIEDANNIFKKANARNMADQLKAQLLAMKFNLAHFDVGDYEYKPGHTLNSLVAEADALLCQSPAPSRCVLEKIKNLLACLNNLCFRYCPQQIDDELSAFGNGCNACQNQQELIEDVF